MMTIRCRICGVFFEIDENDAIYFDIVANEHGIFGTCGDCQGKLGK